MASTARKSGESVDQWFHREEQESLSMDDRVSLGARLASNFMIELMIKALLIGGCFGGGFWGVSSLLVTLQGRGFTCHFGA